MNEQKIEMPLAFDTHVHLRGFGEGEIGPIVLKHHAPWKDGFVAIGNVPAIRTLADALKYGERIFYQCAADQLQISVQIVPMIDSGFTTPQMVYQMADQAHVRIGGLKVMGRGSSTTSQSGSSGHIIGVDLTTHGLKALFPIFQAAQETQLPVLFHSEILAQRHLHDRDREVGFIPILRYIYANFPRLKMSIEHISTSELLNFVAEYYERSEGRVMGGVAPQHMLLSWSDVFTNTLRRWGLFRPPPKLSPDCEALCRAVFGGVPYLYMGTDCAPHWLNLQDVTRIPCGAYNTRVAAAIYAELCERYGGNWQALREFHLRGAKFYGHTHSGRTYWLHKERWQVPSSYDGLSTLCGGEYFGWRVVT